MLIKNHFMLISQVILIGDLQNNVTTGYVISVQVREPKTVVILPYIANNKERLSNVLLCYILKLYLSWVVLHICYTYHAHSIYYTWKRWLEHGRSHIISHPSSFPLVLSCHQISSWSLSVPLSYSILCIYVYAFFVSA